MLQSTIKMIQWTYNYPLANHHAAATVSCYALHTSLCIPQNTMSLPYVLWTYFSNKPFPLDIVFHCCACPSNLLLPALSLYIFSLAEVAWLVKVVYCFWLIFFPSFTTSEKFLVLQAIPFSIVLNSFPNFVPWVLETITGSCRLTTMFGSDRPVVTQFGCKSDWYVWLLLTSECYPGGCMTVSTIRNPNIPYIYI